jgi:hypothetical protein
LAEQELFPDFGVQKDTFGNSTEEELFPDFGAEEKPSTILGEIPRGLKAGVQQLRGFGYGLGALAGEVTGTEGLTDWAKQGLKDVEEKTPPPAVGSLSDIENISDVGKYLAYGVSTNLPNLLLSLAGGGIGYGVGKKIAGKATEEIVKKAVARGALTGAGAASLGMEAGSIAADQLTEAGGVAPLRVALGAIPAAMLDVVPEWYLAKRLGWLGDAAKIEGGRLLRAGKVAAGQFAMEAPTEAMQSVFERAAVPGKSMTNKEAWDDYINSFILGGATGGVVGGVGGLFTKAQRDAQTETVTQKELKTDPLATTIENKIAELDTQGVLKTPMVETPTVPSPTVIPTPVETLKPPEETAGVAGVKEPKFSDKGYKSEGLALTAIKSRKLNIADFDVTEKDGRFFVETKKPTGSISTLAQKIASGAKDFTAEELQIQKNYPQEVESELQKLRVEEPVIPPVLPTEQKVVEETPVEMAPITPKEEIVQPGANVEGSLEAKIKEPLDFQETNQEKIIHGNKKGLGSWQEGMNYRHVLEGTGDIFRSFAANVPDPGYIIEKIDRIKKHFDRIEQQGKHFNEIVPEQSIKELSDIYGLNPKETGIHPEDSFEYSYAQNKEKFEALKTAWEEQPVKTEMQETARQLNIAMLNKDFPTAKKLILKIENNLKSPEVLKDYPELAKEKPTLEQYIEEKGFSQEELPVDVNTWSDERLKQYPITKEVLNYRKEYPETVKLSTEKGGTESDITRTVPENRNIQTGQPLLSRETPATNVRVGLSGERGINRGVREESKNVELGEGRGTTATREKIIESKIKQGLLSPFDSWNKILGFDDNIRNQWKSKLEGFKDERNRIERENRTRGITYDTSNIGKFGTEISDRRRLRDGRKLDTQMQGITSIPEREKWNGVSVSEKFLNTPEFAFAEKHFEKFGYSVVPITRVSWGAAINPETKTAFLGEAYGDRYAYYMSHETSHILSLQKNETITSIKNAIDINHPIAQKYIQKFGWSNERVREEITASIIGGMTENEIVLQGDQTENIKKAKDLLLSEKTMYGEISPFKLPEIVKRQMGTLYSTFTDNPQNLPKDQKKIIDDYMKEQRNLKWYDTTFSVPFRMAQKYKEWKEAWRIHGIERPEKRAELQTEHVGYAEPFLTLRKTLKEDGLTSDQIKESVARVERTIVAGDILLHDRLVSLKDQARNANKEQRMAIQKQINDLQELRRFSDEELKAGIVDEYGDTIKLNDREIEAYASVRKSLDNMMSTMIDWLHSQALRGYRNKKWYNILLQAAGTNLDKEAVRTLVGKKGLNDAAIAYMKKIQVDIDGIFERIEKKITAVPEEEIAQAGEQYGKIATKVSEELLKLQSYVAKIANVKDASELTRELFAAYMRTRPQLTQIKNLRNQMNDWIGFFPRYREQGEHKIRLVEQEIDDEGNITEKPIHSEMFTSKDQYATAYTKIMDLYAKDGKLPDNYALKVEPVTVSPEMAFQGVNDISLQKIFDDAISNMRLQETYFDREGNKINISDQIRDAGLQTIADQFKMRGAMKSSIHRSQKYGTIKGYDETDLHRVLLNYISAMSGIMTKQSAAYDFMNLMKDIKNPSMFSGLATYNKEMLRNDSRGDQVSAKVRSGIFIWYLGGLIKSAIVNLTQNPIVGFAELSKYMREHDLKGIGDVEYTKAMKDVLTKNTTDLESRVIKEMVEKGIAQNQYIQSIFEGLRGKHQQTFLQVCRWLATPFSMTEVYNRKSAAVAMFRQAYPMYQKQGMSDEDAYAKAFEDARTFIDNVHYSYGKANRPLWMGGEGLISTSAKTLYTFRGYTHNFILRQAELLSQKDFRTFFHTMAYVGILGGLAGLPFFKDAFEFMEKQFGFSPSKYVRKSLRGVGGETLEKFGMTGLPSVLGANISGSLAVGLPWPIGSETPEDTIFGVYGGMLQKGKRAAYALGRGDTRRAIAEISPEVLRTPLVAARESKFGEEYLGGTGYATTVRGRPIYDESGKPLRMKGTEVALKSLGFNPTEYAREKEMDQTIRRQEIWVSEEKADISETYRIARLRKDPDALRDMMKSVRELNAKIRSRGIQRLVPLASVSRIIQSSREVKGKKQRREQAYKQLEL